MGLFDNLKNKLDKVVETSAKSVDVKTEEVVFAKLPETLDDFLAMEQAALKTPFDTAAMTVLALCFYPENRELSLKMLDCLRGPRPLSEYDKQFIRDRFMDKDYVPRSYFKGATYKNDYVPSEPYTVVGFTNPHSAIGENMQRIFIASGGADSPRYIDARLAKDGKWYLWEQYLLADIRKPDSQDPWA